MSDRRHSLTLDDQSTGQLPLGLHAAAAQLPESPVAQILVDLNDDQRRAVTHESGPLLIVAGAGTGKTQVITRRIAWLIATKRVRPSEILALTFTDKAAAEMEERVDLLFPTALQMSGSARFTHLAIASCATMPWTWVWRRTSAS